MVRTLLFACGLALVCSAAALGADAPAPTLASFRQLSIEREGRVVAPGTIARFAHLELEVQSGAAFPIRTSAGEVVGFQFEGAGAWRYHVEDREDLQTFADNVAKISRNLNTTKDRIIDTFARATVLFAQPAFEELWNKPDAPAAPASPDAASSFDKTMKLVDKSQLALDFLLAEARLNESRPRMVYVEFDGGIERIGYRYDAVRGNNELLFTFAVYSGYDYRYLRLISRQGVTEGRGGGAYNLEHAVLEVDTPDNQSGSIKAQLVLKLTEPGLRVLPFLLLNNRDPRSERWDSDEKALRVRKVTDADGQPLEFSHRYHELLVDLGSRRAKGSTVRLIVESEGDIFTAAGGYRGDNYVDLFSVSWFPAPERRDDRRFTFELTVKTKKPFRPVSTGEQVSLTEEGDRFTLKARSSTPVWDVALFAGKYKTFQLTDPRWTIRVHAYAYGDEDDLRQLATATAAFMEIYESRLGPCPVKEIELVEMPTFSFWGMSPSGLVILTSRTFQPNDPLSRDYLGNHGVNALIAHELAHQWFGHKAWPVDPEDAWLTESMAEYSAGLAMGVALQAAKASAARMLDFKEMLAQWRSGAKFVETEGTIAAADQIGGALAEEYRFYQLYCRGPLVLHMLRTLIGDERWFRSLRKYLDEANNGPSDTGRLAKAFNAVLGQNIDWYFDQWLHEPGTPLVEVKYQAVVEGGAPILKVQLSQTERPFKKIYVPLLLELPDGKREVRLAFQEQKRQDFSFPLRAAPTRVLVDPGQNNLAVYK